MTHVENYPEELERSLDFFTNPRSYAPFDLTTDLRRVVGCIDPRPEDRDVMKTIVQTPGGAVGHAHDAALAMTVESGELFEAAEAEARRQQMGPSAVPAWLGGVATLGLGFRNYQSMRVTTGVMDAHHGCAFNNLLLNVLEEEANPSDLTLDTIARWSSRYESHGDLRSPIKKISAAAGRLHGHILENGPGEDILDVVNEAYPHHPNITSMVGDNQAGLYIVNHHPHAGLNRERTHRGANPVKVQAYHSNLGASMSEVANLEMTGGIRMGRDLLAGAVLLRSAATRTLLGATPHEGQETALVEVYPSSNESGLEFEVTKVA